MDVLYDLNTNLPKAKMFTAFPAFLNLVAYLAKLKSLYYLSNIWSRFKIIVGFFSLTLQQHSCACVYHFLRYTSTVLSTSFNLAGKACTHCKTKKQTLEACNPYSTNFFLFTLFYLIFDSVLLYIWQHRHLSQSKRHPMVLSRANNIN